MQGEASGEQAMWFLLLLQLLLLPLLIRLLPFTTTTTSMSTSYNRLSENLLRTLKSPLEDLFNIFLTRVEKWQDPFRIIKPYKQCLPTSASYKRRAISLVSTATTTTATITASALSTYYYYIHWSGDELQQTFCLHWPPFCLSWPSFRLFPKGFPTSSRNFFG